MIPTISSLNTGYSLIGNSGVSTYSVLRDGNHFKNVTNLVYISKFDQKEKSFNLTLKPFIYDNKESWSNHEDNQAIVNNKVLSTIESVKNEVFFGGHKDLINHLSSKENVQLFLDTCSDKVIFLGGLKVKSSYNDKIYELFIDVYTNYLGNITNRIKSIDNPVINQQKNNEEVGTYQLYSKDENSNETVRKLENVKITRVKLSKESQKKIHNYSVQIYQLNQELNRLKKIEANKHSSNNSNHHYQQKPKNKNRCIIL